MTVKIINKGMPGLLGSVFHVQLDVTTISTHWMVLCPTVKHTKTFGNILRIVTFTATLCCKQVFFLRHTGSKHTFFLQSQG